MLVANAKMMTPKIAWLDPLLTVTEGVGDVLEAGGLPGCELEDWSGAAVSFPVPWHPGR
jgi:hypothetical protein